MRGLAGERQGEGGRGRKDDDLAAAMMKHQPPTATHRQVDRLAGLDKLEDLLLVNNPLYNDYKDQNATLEYRIEVGGRAGGRPAGRTDGAHAAACCRSMHLGALYMSALCRACNTLRLMRPSGHHVLPWRRRVDNSAASHGGCIAGMGCALRLWLAWASPRARVHQCMLPSAPQMPNARRTPRSLALPVP